MFQVRRTLEGLLLLEETDGAQPRVLPVDPNYLETLLASPVAPGEVQTVTPALAKDALEEGIDRCRFEQQRLSDVRRHLTEAWSRTLRLVRASA